MLNKRTKTALKTLDFETNSNTLTTVKNTVKSKIYAKGRVKRQVGEMNKTELAYSSYLENLKQAGIIDWYCFEGIKLRLAKNTSYTPDFFIMMHDGTLECREVKGYWEDDARVKIKVAAELFPFKFIAVKKNKNDWTEEVF